MKQILNPNCSERILRLKTTNLTEDEIQAIMDKLEEIETREEKKDGDGGDGYWYDTYFDKKTIFDLEVIEIDGEVPYNSYDRLISDLSTLPFWDKVEHETDEK